MLQKTSAMTAQSAQIDADAKAVRQQAVTFAGWAEDIGGELTDAFDSAISYVQTEGQAAIERLQAAIDATVNHLRAQQLQIAQKVDNGTKIANGLVAFLDTGVQTVDETANHDETQQEETQKSDTDHT